MAGKVAALVMVTAVTLVVKVATLAIKRADEINVNNKSSTREDEYMKLSEQPFRLGNFSTIATTGY